MLAIEYPVPSQHRTRGSCRYSWYGPLAHRHRKVCLHYLAAHQSIEEVANRRQPMIHRRYKNLTPSFSVYAETCSAQLMPSCPPRVRPSKDLLAPRA